MQGSSYPTQPCRGGREKALRIQEFRQDSQAGGEEICCLVVTGMAQWGTSQEGLPLAA